MCGQSPNAGRARRRVASSSYRVELALLNRGELVTNSQEKRVNRTAQSNSYRLEKVGKGPHHGRFSLVNVAVGSRIVSGIPGAEFTFSLQEAEEWLAKGGQSTQP